MFDPHILSLIHWAGAYVNSESSQATYANDYPWHVYSSKIFFLWRCCPSRARASSFLRFLDHTQRYITISRTPLDGWSARCRDLYLTTHNTHNRKTSMPPVGFEPTISAGERPQTHALDRAATGTGLQRYLRHYNSIWKRESCEDDKHGVSSRSVNLGVGQNFPSIYGTPFFSNVFTRGPHETPFKDTQIHSTLARLSCSHFPFNVHSHLHVNSSHKIFCCTSHFSHACYM